MGCNKSYGYYGNYGGYHGVQKAMNCGFDASFSKLEKKCYCPPNVLKDITIKEYPIVCEPPKTITIDRVVSLAGIDDALFLVGDIQDGYRMNEDFNLVISDDLIGLQSFNFPSYLFLKAGDLHTLAVSTGDIVNHPISAFLRGNQHLFHGRAVELFELAPQDFEVEANREENCMPHQRHPVIRVIKPTSLNTRYLTIEVSWYEGCQFITREIFYIIPVVCQNCNTAKGANWANWDDNKRTCGEKIRIPGNSTDNGAFKLADKPGKCCGYGDNYGGYGRGCGCGNNYGYGYGSVKFGGFGY